MGRILARFPAKNEGVPQSPANLRPIRAKPAERSDRMIRSDYSLDKEFKDELTDHCWQSAHWSRIIGRQNRLLVFLWFVKKTTIL